MKILLTATLLLLIVFFGIQQRSKELLFQTNNGANERTYARYFNPSKTRKLLELRETIPINQKNFIDWYEIGANDKGGRTRALCVDRSNSNVLLAGGVSGCIWKSTDQGDNWKLKLRTDFEYSITDIVQDPANTNIWYACTGEINNKGGGPYTPIHGAGVLYKSEDKGENWNHVGSPQDENYLYLTSRLAISPTTGTIFVASNGNGIARSVDQGKTFTKCLGKTSSNKLDLDRYNEDFVHADIRVNKHGKLFAFVSGNLDNGAGFFYSNDDGLSWTNLTPNSIKKKYFRDMHRATLAFSESNPNVVYGWLEMGVDAYNENNGIGFYKFNLQNNEVVDRSQNLPKVVYQGKNYFIPAPQDSYCMMLDVKPDDENFIMIGGASGGPQRSFDGFASAGPSMGNIADIKTTKYQINKVGTHNDIHVAAFDPNNPNKLYVGTDGGVYMVENCSEPNGNQSWVAKNNGLNIGQYYNLAISPKNGDNRVVVNSQDNGNMLLEFNASSKQTVKVEKNLVCGGDGINSIWANGYLLLTGFGGSSPCYFTNDKISGTDYYTFSNSSGIIAGAYVRTMADSYLTFDPQNENTVFASFGLDELFRTTQALSFAGMTTEDIKQKWTSMSVSDLEMGSNYTFTALEFSKNNSDQLYFSVSAKYASYTKKPAIFKLNQASQSNLSTAIKLDATIFPEGGQIIDIALNPINSDEILVVMENYNIPSLFYSNNGGSTFTLVDGNLEQPGFEGSHSANTAAIIPTANMTWYLVGTQRGLFITHQLNAANTEWKREAYDLIGNAIVSDIRVRLSDHTIAIATYGRGAFIGNYDNFLTTTVSETDTDEVCTTFPNPATNSFTLRFLNSEIPRSIIIRNCTGQMVKTLEDVHSSNQIDISKWLAGIYYIQFELGNRLHVKTMVKTD